MIPGTPAHRIERRFRAFQEYGDPTLEIVQSSAAG
jgi:hypothetical protein